MRACIGEHVEIPGDVEMAWRQVKRCGEAEAALAKAQEQNQSLSQLNTEHKEQIQSLQAEVRASRGGGQGAR